MKSVDYHMGWRPLKDMRFCCFATKILRLVPTFLLILDQWLMAAGSNFFKLVGGVL